MALGNDTAAFSSSPTRSLHGATQPRKISEHGPSVLGGATGALTVTSVERVVPNG